MPKKSKKAFREKKWLIAIIVALGLVFIFFGAKIILYIHFLLGNDIIVKLAVDQDILYMSRGQEKNITFEASLETNPFCNAECTSIFMDIGRGTVIENASFSIKPGKPLKKEYTLKAAKLGSGQELYSFTMECHSIQTTLCPTSEEPTERKVLVAMNYDLAEAQKNLKADLKGQLEQLSQQIAVLYAQHSVTQRTIGELDKRVVADTLRAQSLNTNQSISLLAAKMPELRQTWQNQDYQLLAEETDATARQYASAAKAFSEFNRTIGDTLFSYNQLILGLNMTREKLGQIRLLVVNNPISPYAVNRAVDDFNADLQLLNMRTSLVDKENLLSTLIKKAAVLESSTEDEIRRQTLKYELGLDTDYDALCSISGMCTQHPTIEERSTQDKFDLQKACLDADRFRARLALLNESVANKSDEFWRDAAAELNVIRLKITNEYIEQLPLGETNTQLIKELLYEQVGTYSATNGSVKSVNNTEALVAELQKELPEPCDLAERTVSQLRPVGLEQIEAPQLEVVPLGISFDEPQPECCLSGSCSECCTTAECRNNPETFPIIFLHGHSLNKKVSFEYSLDAFNKIQNRLAADGYINAGAISTYATQNISEGAFGMSSAPLTIKASYYFDIYKQPENYVLVQTKSQNIDSYAIRLKDIIENVKRMTGRPKVILIAHSMGGLVARRYLQVFGASEVEKAILIAVPNKGIVGKTADYCPIVGERLECEDMNADSLFINKLNQGSLSLPIYNIVGTGCSMTLGPGDGVVLEKDAKLDGATNYLVNGTCKGLELLHTRILDTDSYPQVYQYIREALSSSS